MIALIYYTSKFYTNAELLFHQNQFSFFIAFALIVLFLILLLFYYIFIVGKRFEKAMNERDVKFEKIINEKDAKIESLLNEIIQQNGIHSQCTEEHFDQIIESSQIINELILDTKG